MSLYSTVSEAIESLTVLQNKLKFLSDSVDGIARKLDAEVLAKEPDDEALDKKTYFDKLDDNHWYNCSVFHFENLGFGLDNKNVLIVAVPVGVNMNYKNATPMINLSDAFVCQLCVPSLEKSEHWTNYFTNKYALAEWVKEREWKSNSAVSFWFTLI